MKMTWDRGVVATERKDIYDILAIHLEIYNRFYFLIKCSEILDINIDSFNFMVPPRFCNTKIAQYARAFYL